MSLNIGVLGQVLFSPRKAFESIKEQTSMGDGIAMYILLVVLGSIIGLVLTSVALGTFAIGVPYITGLGVQIIIGIVSLLAVGWVASKLAGAIGKGTPSTDKTIGFLGYAQVVAFVIGLLGAILGLVLGGAVLSAAGSNPGATMGAAFGALGIVAILGIIGFIWSLYVGGTAVSVANNVSLGAGVASYFLAAIIVGFIVVGIIMAAVLAIFGLGVAGAGLGGI